MLELVAFADLIRDNRIQVTLARHDILRRSALLSAGEESPAAEPITMAVRAATIASRAVLGAVLIGAALSPPVKASGVQTSLGAHNTITAVGDGYMDVILPADVALPLKEKARATAGPASWITFEGGGRVVGMVLMPKGSNDPISSGLVAVQFRSCRRGCPERPVNALMINGASFRGKEMLSSGEYRLYVFTDGTRATISLDLPQLASGTHIRIAGQGDADIRTPAVQLEHRDDATAYTARASYEMKDHAGLFMAVNVMRDDNYRDASFDECLSPDHMTPDEVETRYCFPTGGNTFVRPLDPTKIHPKKGGFILTTFLGLHDANDSLINGYSSLQHYSFRVISPGPVGELWSQGVLLSFL